MRTRVAMGRLRSGADFERVPLGRMARRRRVAATKSVARVAIRKERV